MAQQSDRMRILIVDDSGETREYLRKLLYFEQNLELVGAAADGEEGVELARQLKPDLVLMDINMPGMDGITAADIISRELPTTRIVMMSVQREIEYLRRAMQAGAREFLIKPFSYDELMNVIGQVGSLSTPAPDVAVPTAPTEAVAPTPAVAPAVVTAVFSPRGGAGCSTIAANLAVAVAGQRQAKVVLLDFNFRFGALDALLNLQPTRSIADLIHHLDTQPVDIDLVESVLLPHPTGLYLLAAPPSPEMADLVTTVHLENLLHALRSRFDYIIVDVGTALDDNALTALDAADRIFLVVTPDIPAIKNARLFLALSSGLDYPPEKIVLVLNQDNPRTGITAAAIEKHIQWTFGGVIPSDPRSALGAINRGVPLIMHNPSSPATKGFLALVERIPEKETAPSPPVPPRRRARRAAPPPQKKPGFLKSLFRRGG